MVIIEDMELPTGCDVCPCCQKNIILDDREAVGR